MKQPCPELGGQGGENYKFASFEYLCVHSSRQVGGSPARRKMKNLDQIKAVLSQDKPIIQKKYHVSELGIFGSYVRGEQKEDSDIDVLIDYTEAPSLLELLDLEFYLSDLLGIKADVVTKKGLKSRYRKRILAEVVYI